MHIANMMIQYNHAPSHMIDILGVSYNIMKWLKANISRNDGTNIEIE